MKDSPPPDDKQTQGLRAFVDSSWAGPKRRRFTRFCLAAAGSIPWVGGLIAATAALDAEREQDDESSLRRQWLEEHRQKVEALAQTVASILQRLEEIGVGPEGRADSDEYLAIVRQGFRIWDEAPTSEKRELITTLMTNAGASTVCSDDVVRMFLDWIARFHELHFAVIRAIYRDPGITRGQIWDVIHGRRPREDSAEADIYRLIIRDLSTGGVVRQERSVTYDGQFEKRRTRRPKSTTMKSAFDNEDPYVLTELGRHFVHYCIDQAAPRVGGGAD